MSAHDALFLHWERPEHPMHVAECMVYAGTFTAVDLQRAIARRMSRLPRYRQRIVVPPLHLAHPTWEDDPRFDIEHHVDGQELPEPGDDAALQRACGQLFGELLDRDRPLWKATVLSGYGRDRTVVFLRLHHAMVDGVSSIDIVEALHAAAPFRQLPHLPESTPGRRLQVQRGLSDQARGAVSGLAGIVRNPPSLRRLQTTARTAVHAAELVVRRRPPTPFNHPISAAREIAWLEVPLAEARVLARASEATLNDLVLAVLAGAIGRYMRRHGHPTDGIELRTMCPVSVRAEGEQGALGNRVSMVIVPLFVGELDGRRRLQLQHDAMVERKQREEASGWLDLMGLMGLLPPAVFSQLRRLYPGSSFPLNIVSTNVRGPGSPLFLDGHELLHWYPVGVQWTDMGLFLCTLSYGESLTFGLVADPQIVPDLQDVVGDFRASYDEITSAL